MLVSYAPTQSTAESAPINACDNEMEEYEREIKYTEH